MMLLSPAIHLKIFTFPVPRQGAINGKGYANGRFKKPHHRLLLEAMLLHFFFSYSCVGYELAASHQNIFFYARMAFLSLDSVLQ
jgi:hypothetical protein